MKFLCRNCKAKYQIADEKVAGRTLRMTCQQCGEPIVVRGASRASSAQLSRPLAPAALGTAPSALGADFQRQLSIPAREMPAPVHEEWHVAINDVPVGPMRRDEVARKIAMGAIDRESLCWREGMDDWLPIKHIAELSGLFPGTGPGKTATGSIGLPPGSLPPPSAAGASVPPPAPAARADMAPIGGRQVVAVEEYAAPPEEEQVAVATMASPPTEASGQGKQIGWGPMFMLVAGGAFILAMGAFLGVKVLAPAPAAPVAVAPQPAAAAAHDSPPPPAAAAPAAAPQNNVIELDMQAIDGTSGQRRASGSSTGSAPVASADKGKAPSGKPLTAEQKEMLERMGGGLNQGPSNIRSQNEARNSAGGAQNALTAEQLSAVVNNGRKNLQRCYETALRGSNSSETVRLDVDIQVSPSGNVTSVRTAGKGLPGMDDCITRTVRMWRFPMSSESTQTRFPVVFQPGA
jgi:hypothetical protein